MNKEKIFIARDENGSECQYEMLMVKNVDNIPVIWYTDGSKDEDGSKNVYISTYERTDTTFSLNPIENEETLQKYADIFSNEYKE